MVEQANQIGDFVDQRPTKRGGCGGKFSKSFNFKESKQARKNRNEKYEREAQKYEDQARLEWLEAEDKRWAPVDKTDEHHLKKLAEKS